MDNAKNSTLELLKLLASYMVVFIHVRFSGKIGTAIVAVARFAVPFFFFISGFYSYRISPRKLQSRIKNILNLLILATMSYTVFNIVHGGDISAYVSKYTDLFTLVKLFIFNVSICSVHLWYLYAILYVYVIFYFATLVNVNDKVLSMMSVLLLFLHILLGEVLSFFGIILPSPILRNFAVMGIPLFALGQLFQKYQHKFLNIPNYVILLSIIIGALESILSRFLFGGCELYIGSLFILFGLACVFIKYSNVKYPMFIIALEGCNTYIYIFHIMISAVICSIYTVIGIDMNSSVVLKNLHPIIVCIISTVFSYMLIKILKNWQRHKDNIQLYREQGE